MHYAFPIHDSVMCLPAVHATSNRAVKVKLSLYLISLALHREDMWMRGGLAPHFLTLALDGGEWSALCLYRREKSPWCPLWIGGFVSPRVSLDVVRERTNLAQPGIEPVPSSP
jgi:hypothetical protein